ncbi:hypothetical protein ACFLYG_02795 [Chloroflexota bacterium]
MAFGLRICVVVCLDVMDYSTAASIVQHGDEIDFLLVPTYSENLEGMEKIAREIAGALPGGVALVDHERGVKYSNCLWLFDQRKEHEHVKQNMLEKGGNVNLYEIDFRWFQDTRLNRIERTSKSAAALFGRPGISHVQ